MWRRVAVAAGMWSALATGVPGSSEGALPDGRVYEQVSPAAKNGADVMANPSRTRAAADGNAIQFASLAGFGDVAGMGVSADYVAVRAPGGVWKTHGITPHQEPATALEAVFGLESRYLGEFSGDLSRGVFVAKSPLTEAPNVADVVNIYLRTDLLTPGVGTYRLLSDATTVQAPGDPFSTVNQPYVVDASTDFTKIVFESPRNLTADAVDAGLDPSDPKVYEWADGTLRLVGILPTADGGGPTVSQSGQTVFGYSGETMSEDGDRVVFSAPPFENHAAGTLYERDDQGTAVVADDETTHVNASERTDCNDDPTCGDDGGIPDPAPAAPQPAKFWTASADGSQLFLTTAEQLTDDDVNASQDLYRFDANAPEGHRLTRLSGDGELADNPGNDPHFGNAVLGVIAASRGGDYVYFASDGQLVSGGPTGPTGGTTGGARIFVWHAGALREVGAVNVDELPQDFGLDGWLAGKLARVTPDGTHMVFATQGTDELLQLYGHAGYDHGNSCPRLTFAECEEIYVYDAAANGGNGELQCASCNPTGAPAQTDASFYPLSTGKGGSNVTSHLNHVISDDGRFVFFNSGDQLVPSDRNTAFDAYEFDTVTREVHLISIGTGNGESSFMDASPDGHDVFFTTREPLSPNDTDRSVDLYDARVNGESPPPPTPIIPCTEDACRPPAVVQSGLRVPPSVDASGPGDRLEGRGPLAALSIKPLTRKQRRSLTTRGTADLVVVASQPGGLTIRVAARLDGRRRTMQIVHRTVTIGTASRIRIRLTRAARRHLHEQGNLHLAVTAIYSREPNPQTLHITLRSSHA